MKIKKYLTELWDKIKYDESGQLSNLTPKQILSYSTPWNLGRALKARKEYLKATVPKKISELTPKEALYYATPYNIGQALSAREEYLKQQAKVKPTREPTPKQMFVSKVPYPTSELAQSPESYYSPSRRTPERSIFQNLPEAPKVTPLVTGTAEPPSASDTKVLAYLKEYVGQMRAAGFPDYFIRKKLMATSSIFIPDELPANFGQTGPWATGMGDEFKQAMQQYKNEQGLLPEDIMLNYVPSPNEYLNYMPGGTASRLPTYGEFTGQETSPYFDPSGKFSQAKIENLRGALANYMTTYKGETAPFSQWTAEAGIGGLPKDIAQQYYQGFLELAQQKAEEAKAQEEYKGEIKGQQEVYKGEMDVALKEAQSLVDEWMKTTSEGGTFLAPIQDTDDKGNPINRDPLELIIGYIRSGESIENIAAFINSNQIPITNYQLQGLYYLYGQ